MRINLRLDDLETAMHHFELAKERDPEFALPFAGIAMVWMFRQQLGMASPEEAGPKIMEAVGRAHELDNTLAEVHFITAADECSWECGTGKPASQHIKKPLRSIPTIQMHMHYIHNC